MKDVHIAKDGTIRHYLTIPMEATYIDENGSLRHCLPKPLEVGSRVEGRLDFMTRFRRMQNHSGEHVVSGLIYAAYGYHNVGFHLSDEDMTMDFDGELTKEQLADIEWQANLAVAADVPVTAEYPAPEVLKNLQYRSKLDLTEDVRIVTIEGYDVCACCAPHVKRTGQIGMIKLLDFARYKGGVRIHARCGLDALEDHRSRYAALNAAALALSTNWQNVAESVARLQQELDGQKRRADSLMAELLQLRVNALLDGQKNVCLFADGLDSHQLVDLANMGLDKCSGISAAFSGSDGNYRYAIASRSVNLRDLTKQINSALNGRGGGRPDMLQGSCNTDKTAIEAFFAQL